MERLCRVDFAMKVPEPESLDAYYPLLSQMVAKTSWLPHPETVKAVGRAVFPTARAKAKLPRFTAIKANGNDVGMYDDNATPEWALFWSHGLEGERPKGWAVAHVWHASDDIDSYTHLANLALVPESFSSLTDKAGALTAYLRWHAWTIYGWKPALMGKPEKPSGYDGVNWRYLEMRTNPIESIREELLRRDNQRTRFLVPVMQQLNFL